MLLPQQLRLGGTVAPGAVDTDVAFHALPGPILHPVFPTLPAASPDRQAVYSPSIWWLRPETQMSPLIPPSFPHSHVELRASTARSTSHRCLCSPSLAVWTGLCLVHALMVTSPFSGLPICASVNVLCPTASLTFF